MRDIWLCALKSISRKWTRTLLTVSGITVGVTMVAIVAVISSAGKYAVNSELDKMGVDGLSVSTSGGIGTVAGLTLENLETIRGISNVNSAMPLVIEYAISSLRNNDASTLVCGIDSGAKQVISLELEYGRLISRGDVKAAARVCVVDQTVAQNAYQRENITGKHVTLNIAGSSEEFEIIGVTATGSSLLQNIVEFIPGMIYVPYTTLQSITGRETIDQIAVRVEKDADVKITETRITDILEHTTGRKNFFRTDNLAMQKDRLSNLLDIVTLVLTFISGISLLVSGLGIMTIMLVSVNERTREIGIKKAIGASRKRILFEFLAEAVIISLLGSLSGVLLGATAAWAGVSLFGFSVPLPLSSFGWLIVFAVAIGAVFGVYPAVKASKLRPVEALRAE